MKKSSKKFTVNEAVLFQLYEKGLISAKTVLEGFGMDVEKEVSLPNSQNDLGKDPEWIKLQKEQLFLSNQEYAAKITQRKAESLSNQMEHARRNVEILSKVLSGLVGVAEWDKDAKLRSLLIEVLDVNTKVLKEIGKV